MRQRDEKGRFIKGQSGNPEGRPPKEREQEFMNVTLSAVSLADWKEIIQKAAWQAKKGDSQARKFLADYLIGPPVQKSEVSGTEGGPLEIIVRYANQTASRTDITE